MSIDIFICMQSAVNKLARTPTFIKKFTTLRKIINFPRFFLIQTIASHLDRYRDFEFELT